MRLYKRLASLAGGESSGVLLPAKTPKTDIIQSCCLYNRLYGVIIKNQLNNTD